MASGNKTIDNELELPVHAAGSGADPELDEHFLPPRRTVHPPESEKWVRFLYRPLLWLLVFLVAGLVVWGWQVIGA